MRAGQTESGVGKQVAQVWMTGGGREWVGEEGQIVCFS